MGEPGSWWSGHLQPGHTWGPPDTCQCPCECKGVTPHRKPLYRTRERPQGEANTFYVSPFSTLSPLLFEKGAVHFRFDLDPTNYAASLAPVCRVARGFFLLEAQYRSPDPQSCSSRGLGRGKSNLSANNQVFVKWDARLPHEPQLYKDVLLAAHQQELLLRFRGDVSAIFWEFQAQNQRASWTQRQPVMGAGPDGP